MEAEMYVHHAEPLRANMVTCIPRLRGGGGVRRRPRQHSGAPPAPASSLSVIDRVRDVLLRLAMLSAASPSSPKHGARLHQKQQQTTTAPGPPTRAASVRMSPSYSDSYPSDAVDDCIEFLKRSAAGSGGGAVHAAVPAAPEPVISSAAP